MRAKVIAATAALMLTGLVTAGCGSSSSKSSSAAATSSSASGGSSTSSSGGGGSSTSSSGGGGSSSSAPFRVFFDADTTGPLKAFGEQDLNGIKSVIDFLNAKGGIDGHHITLDTMSSNGDAATAVSNLVKYLSSNPKPNFVFAGTAGDETAAMIPVTVKDGLLAASVNDGNSQCAKNSQTACSTFFTVAAPTVTPQKSVANFMASKGIKKVGILAETEAFTQSETPAVTSTLKAKGISVEQSTFPGTATDVTSEMQELKNDGVQAVYAEVLGAPAGYVAAARAKLAWNVPIVYDVAASSMDISSLAPASQLKNTYELIFRTNDPPIANKLPGIKALVSGAKKYGGVGGVQPINVAAFPWDDLLVVAAGAKTANSISANAIMAAMIKTPTTDPALTLNATQKYTAAVHENVAATPSEYPVVPVGPIKNGMVQPLGK
jgi:ABC-type branched-subunit amino acid transport system substrate-binding protein